MSVYYSIKRQMMRVRCLFGRKQMRRVAGQNRTGNGTKLTFEEQLAAQLMQDAQRQVTRLFKGKA